MSRKCATLPAVSNDDRRLTTTVHQRPSTAATPAETGQPIWTMRKGGKQIDAELRGHGEWGWNANFSTMASCTVVVEARAEADEKRQELERDGWTAA